VSRNGLGRIEDAVIPDEVDRDTGVVGSDRGLVGNFTHLLSQVCLNAAIDEGNQEDDSRAFGPDTAPQAENHHALVFGDDFDRTGQYH